MIPAPSRDRTTAPALRTSAAGALLVAGCLWIYAGIGGFGFVGLDDDYNIVFNPHMGGLSVERVAWAFSDMEYMRRYVPLGWLALSAAFEMFGLNAGGFHAIALVMHAINAVLLLALFQRLLLRWLGESAGWARTACAFGAVAWWAWHPMRVEFVAWASGLLYLFAMFWLFLALWLQVMVVGSGGWLRPSALLCYTASLLTYPIALGGWALVVLLDAPLAGWRHALRRNVDYMAAALAVLALTLAARIWTIETFHGVAGWNELSLGRRMLQAMYVWGHYIWRAAWPWALTPVDTVLQFEGVAPARVWLGAALPVALTIALLAWRRTRTWPLYFWAAYLAVLVPFLGVMEKPHYPSDRYSFLAHLVLAAGGAAALALRIDRWPGRFRVVAAAGAALLVIALAGLSRVQTEIWRDEASLWTALAQRPMPEALEARYALWQARQGDVEAALEHLERRLATAGAAPAALRDVSALIARLDRENRERATALGLAAAPPLAAVLHHDIAVRCRQRGEIASAAHHLLEVRRLAPEYYLRITGSGNPPAR
jgi:protein O-mannosyl-transferase